jgi:kynurenine formamidase
MLNQNVVDLTQTLDPSTPDWDGCCSFQMHETFHNNICLQSLQTPAGIGTHIDAPQHFVEGATDISTLPLENLICPAFIIDVRNKITPGYFLSVEEIKAFENKHKKIEPNSIVLLLTGWANR